MITFITGGTGFVGKFLVESLHAGGVSKIYLLVRQGSFFKANKLFKNLAKVQIVLGDLSHTGLVYDQGIARELQDNVEQVIHCGAMYDVKANHQDAYLHNVLGTQNVLQFVQGLKRCSLFHYVSTIGLTGDYCGELAEDQLPTEQNFSDFYSQTKMRAEFMVRKWDLGTRVKRIYRPGIVVGDSQQGEIERVDGPYFFIYHLQKALNRIPFLRYFPYVPIPCSQSATLPLIPVDILIEQLTHMILKPQDLSNLCKGYHLMSSDKILMAEFVRLIFKRYKMRSDPHFIDLTPPLRPFLSLWGVPPELASYSFSSIDYRVENKRSDYPELKDFKLIDFEEAFFYGIKNINNLKVRN